MTSPHNDTVYTRPPGLVGEVANFIYNAAARPDPVIALAGAFGFMAGIVGRSYNVLGAGMNIYATCLAPTGAGKNAIADGIDVLIEAIAEKVPAARGFVGPAEISSAPALHKQLAEAPNSFASINGESGLQRQQIAKGNVPPHLLDLKRLKLTLYSKSGRGQILRERIYSEKARNTPAILAPAYTEIGESTPEMFYEAINENSIMSGQLPREIVFESRALRPPLNRKRLTQPPPALVEALQSLCAESLNLNHAHNVIDVQFDEQAAALMDWIDSDCTNKINAASNEVQRQLWNRAHQNALKLAGIVAIGCNSIKPTITEQQADWAARIIYQNINNILSRLDDGDNADANGEDVRLKKLAAAFIAFYQADYAALASYDVRHDMHADSIVSLIYLQRRLCNTKPFRKSGSVEPTELLKRALRTLIERGEVQHVSQADLQNSYGYSGVAYASVKLKRLADKSGK